MQSDAAVFRTQSSLEEGVKKMSDVYRTFDKVGIKGKMAFFVAADFGAESDFAL